MSTELFVFLGLACFILAGALATGPVDRIMAHRAEQLRREKKGCPK